MKATKISIVITRNLGNYENVRLEAGYDVEEGENLTDCFVKGKTELLTAFNAMFRNSHRNLVQAWNTTPEQKPEEVKKTAGNSAVTLKTLELSSPEFDNVCMAIHQGRIDVPGLEKYFVLGDGVLDYLNKHF